MSYQIEPNVPTTLETLLEENLLIGTISSWCTQKRPFTCLQSEGLPGILKANWETGKLKTFEKLNKSVVWFMKDYPAYFTIQIMKNGTTISNQTGGEIQLPNKFAIVDTIFAIDQLQTYFKHFGIF